MRPRLLVLAAAPLALAAGLSARGPAAEESVPALAWPVACKVGTSCEIQHYIDHDPSPAAKDYACGTRTYDKHDGVDIRLPDMAAQRRGVAVLAAADGKVLRARDGVADILVTANGGLATVANLECGNGMVIAHAGGWETQYCHLAKGSLIVKPGDVVKAGQPLGKVGFSGAADFPHLHFTIRQDGKVVDPFAYGAAEGSCRAGRSLWAATPAYEARVVLNTGFAAAPVTMAGIEDGGIAAPAADAPILVAYARAAGLKAGDVQTLTVRTPDGGMLVDNTAEPLPRDQAQRMMFAGRRKPAQGWAKGRYAATYTVSAGGKPVLTRSFTFTL